MARKTLYQVQSHNYQNLGIFTIFLFFCHLCVGEIESLRLLTTQPLLVKATGHGCRQVIPMNKYGFPREGYKAKKPVPGWKTGDIVNVVAGKNAWLKSVRML